jgi:DNA-directed RNA polymerase specialized sigma subunit
MTAREYLNRAYEMHSSINSMIEQVEIMETVACKITTSFSDVKVQGGMGGSPLEIAVMKVLDVKKQLGEMIDSFRLLQTEIKETINAVEGYELRQLLELRYLCFNDWDDIAKKMRFSVSYVLKLHRLALRKLDSILDNTTKPS